jgi:UPF0755 protein
VNRPSSEQSASGRGAPDPALWRRRIWGGSAVLLAVLLAAALWFWQVWTQPAILQPGHPGSVQEVRVPSGTNLAVLVDTLAARGLLARPELLRLVARLTGRDRHLQAGTYALSPGLSPRELLARLTGGQTLPVLLTLPEGIEAEKAARAVESALGCSAVDFLAAADSLARQGVLAHRFLGDAVRVAEYDTLMRRESSRGLRVLHWCEGYLAPDTYHFAEGTAAADVAREIVTLGLARVDSIARSADSDLQELGLTPHQITTLASLVEAEARRADERPLIAAVYVNRLRRGWRLEADPCVAYLLGKRGQRLYYVDLGVDSPYNTYRHAGLPPGPIGNPGRMSLQAAAHPATDSTAFFFVADGEGGHVFSQTRAEHERAVSRYRRLRRSAGR